MCTRNHLQRLELCRRRRIERRLAVAGLAAGIGMRQPQPPDEPRFVLAARTMVESGQWLLPHRGVELYAEKPPVFMWLQAAAHQVVGSWQWSFLLPSLLAALLSLWLSESTAEKAGFLVSFLVITSLFILFADLFPKRLGMAEPERLVVRLAQPMAWCTTLLRPLVWFYSRGADALFRLLGLASAIAQIVWLDPVALATSAAHLAEGWQAPTGGCDPWGVFVGPRVSKPVIVAARAGRPRRASAP